MSFLTRRIVISVDREAAALRRVVAFCRSPFARARRPAERSSTLRSSRDLAATLDDLDRRYGAPTIERTRDDAPNDASVLLLDGSAVVAVARGNANARMRLRDAARLGTRVIVAASTLADPRVAALAERIATTVEIDERVGNEAVRLVAETRLALLLDALTVACAPLGERVAILTADPAGVGAFVRASGRTDLRVIRV